MISMLSIFENYSTKPSSLACEAQRRSLFSFPADLIPPRWFVVRLSYIEAARLTNSSSQFRRSFQGSLTMNQTGSIWWQRNLAPNLNGLHPDPTNGTSTSNGHGTPLI